ncbi:GIMA2 GTPase, partial [Amia calva]|nr:GIMA2 GTPase [Amia calva]
MGLAAPGPHVFLLVIQVGRFTEGEKKMIEQLKRYFGQRIIQRIIVLFTHGDELKRQSIHQFVYNTQPDLQKLIGECGDRYHLFNNRDTRSNRQVKELLDKIDRLVQERGGGYFTTERFPVKERPEEEEEMEDEHEPTHCQIS